MHKCDPLQTPKFPKESWDLLVTVGHGLKAVPLGHQGLIGQAIQRLLQKLGCIIHECPIVPSVCLLFAVQTLYVCIEGTRAYVCAGWLLICAVVLLICAVWMGMQGAACVCIETAYAVLSTTGLSSE